MQTIALSPRQKLEIGRDSTAEIVIDDATLSRRHVRIESTQDGQVWVDDLNSRNGTFIDGEKITRSLFVPGQQLTLGTVIVTLETGNPSLNRIVGHDHFLQHFENELERARAHRRTLALLFVKLADHAPQRQNWLPEMKCLQPYDRVGLYAPGVFELLCPERTYEQIKQLLTQWQSSAGNTVRAGCAFYPQDGSTVDELLEFAREAIKTTHVNAPFAPLSAEQIAPDFSPDVSMMDVRRVVDEGPVVTSAIMVKLYKTIDQIARSALTVLILGETGSGKEVVARTIHTRSSRCNAPFHALNCGAIPQQLLESVLFGHERGAFTGADKRQPGVFESAKGGTVFLDEIGELPPQAQVSLLRVLESRAVTRIGSSVEIPIDVRIVAATHRDLEAAVAQGSFRADLFYRLNALTLVVPPLRDRPEEIEALVARFIVSANRSNQRDIRGIANNAVRALRAWHWPGNVRELRNVIERAVVIATGETISLEELPEAIKHTKPRVPSSTHALSPTTTSENLLNTSTADHEEHHTEGFKERIAQFEKRLIITALVRQDGNQVAAAQMLQISRNKLIYKMMKYGLSADPATWNDPNPAPDTSDTTELDLEARVTRFEIELLTQALNASDGNLSRTARYLHMPERTLAHKLKQLGIVRE